MRPPPRIPIDFPDDFDDAPVRKRALGFIAALALLWVTFLICAVSTVIWLLGRWIGAW